MQVHHIGYRIKGFYRLPARMTEWGGGLVIVTVAGSPPAGEDDGVGWGCEDDGLGGFCKNDE